MFFQSGYDFFDELPPLGIEINHHGKPDEDIAQEAWRRLGAQFLAEFEGQPGQYGHYAVRVFGDPPREKRRAGSKA